MTTVDSATPVASSKYRRMLRRGGGIADISSTSMSASQFSLVDGDRMWLDSRGAATIKWSSTPAPDPSPPVGLSLSGMGVSILHLLYGVTQSAPDAWQVARAHDRHDA